LAVYVPAGGKLDDVEPDDVDIDVAATCAAAVFLTDGVADLALACASGCTDATPVIVPAMTPS
jgi:hypothetical protein